MSVETRVDPSAGQAGVDVSDERRLAVGAVRTLALLAVPVVGVAGFVAGAPGVTGALIGLGFVLLLFGASAMLLLWAAARGNSGIAVLTAGAAVRLPLYFLVLRLLDGVTWIHGRSLAAATGIAVAVTLAYELRLMATMPRLFWVDAAADRPSAATNDTRSQTL